MVIISLDEPAVKITPAYLMVCSISELKIPNLKSQIPNKIQITKLSSITKTVCLEFCVCLLGFVCYLEFVIWKLKS
ncbi:MAG: hypothetical protein MAG551_00022 [Candidatus Scalindua arabica]|uniref:Uncharacterized protein n=1 Tax=Candidatus Scalindua arabica TaxID=1127984 RepID=A0A941VZH2_9BACT|nr:hypothetical protein [Candidatus Scalindua arabica]